MTLAGALGGCGAPEAEAAPEEPLAVSCVGDSNTEGYGHEGSWPGALAALLVDAGAVTNYDVSGTTAWESPERSYRATGTHGATDGRPECYHADGVHLNEKGDQVVANLVAREIAAL